MLHIRSTSAAGVFAGAKYSANSQHCWLLLLPQARRADPALGLLMAVTGGQGNTKELGNHVSMLLHMQCMLCCAAASYNGALLLLLLTGVASCGSRVPSSTG
jgi:hypothetical protein